MLLGSCDSLPVYNILAGYVWLKCIFPYSTFLSILMLCMTKVCLLTDCGCMDWLNILWMWYITINKYIYHCLLACGSPAASGNETIEMSHKTHLPTCLKALVIKMVTFPSFPVLHPTDPLCSCVKKLLYAPSWLF